MGLRDTSIVLLLIAGCGRFGFEEDGSMAPDAAGDAGDGLARITVERVGATTSVIVGTDGFSCSTSSCTLAVPIGTAVWLRTVPTTESWFAGWTGKCSGNFECAFDATADTTIRAEFSPVPNRMFVTSTTTNGAIGGVAGADAICTARAAAAGLTGTFIAYISDTTTDAENRLTGSRGWIRIDGAPFADSPNAFGSGDIVFPPRLDESGDDLGNVVVFTGTSGGTAATNVCLDWTSNLATESGLATRSHYASASMDGGNTGCDKPGHLMCLEVNRNVAVAVRPDQESALAFVTRSRWTPGGGRDSADAVCQADAASAGRTGTFLAALATTTESIESRFPPGEVYRRVDGVRLLAKPGLFAADYLDVPPELDGFGMRVDDDFWTGATAWSSPAQAANNCADWTDGSGVGDGRRNGTVYTQVRNSSKLTSCNVALPLLCLAR